MTRPPKRPSAGDYQVGYGKPSRHARFRPGVSGNPRGRPRGASAGRADRLALKEIYRLIAVREGDQTIVLPTVQAVIRQLGRIALKGKRGSRASRSGRSSNCTPIWLPSATTVPTIAWRPSLATGRPLGNRNRRRAAAACSCRWRFWRAKRSSSTGRKTGRSSAASGPNCRSLTSSSPTAAPSFSGPVRSRPMRCCSTPITTLSASWAACRGGAFTTNMRTAVDKIGRGKERQVNARFSAMVSHFLFEAEFCNPASGWEKGQIEKNVRGTPAIGSGSRCPTSPPWRR